MSAETDLKSVYESMPNFKDSLLNVIKIAEDPYDKSQTARHLKIINDFLESAPKAIFVEHISYFIRLLQSLHDIRVRSFRYRSCYLKALDVCLFPPILKKTSDILEYDEDIRQFLNMFGYFLVHTRSYTEFTKITVGLEKMFTKEEKRPLYCISNRVLNEMLSTCNLPVIIAELLHMCNFEIYQYLLKLTLHLLENETTCRTLIMNRVIDTLVSRLNVSAEYLTKCNLSQFGATTEVVPVHFHKTLRIIWRLTQVYTLSSKQFRKDVGEAVSSEAWASSRSLFQNLTISRAYKKERNALLRFLCLACKVYPVGQLQTFQIDLYMFGVATEIGTAGTWAASTTFTTDNYDFEFKLLTMSFICYNRSYPIDTRTLHKRNVLVGLLRILMPEVDLIWKGTQRMKLMKYALISLECIVENLLPYFVNHSGPARLARVFDNAIKGILPFYLILPCLTCIHTTLAYKSPIEMAKKYRVRGAIDSLLSYVEMTTKKSTMTKKDQKGLTITFCILQLLYREFTSPRTKLIDTCLACIKRYLSPTQNDCFLEPKVMVALLDFLWENIIWSDSDHNLFFSSGGIYLLLDVIETFPTIVKLIALSILVDLTEDGESIPFIATWRGKTSSTAITLLLQVFRLGHDRNANVTDSGIVKDINFPLMGYKQIELTFKRRKDPNSSPSSLDLLGNTRAKVYALLHMLQCSPKTKEVYAHYAVQETQLTELDEITIILAENFLRLKVQEAWIELYHDLWASGIRTLGFDNLVMSFHIEYGAELVETIKNMQSAVLRGHAKHYLIEERNIYQRLKYQVLQEAFEGLDEIYFSARCTETLFRVFAKDKQKTQTLNTKKYVDSTKNWHRTFMVDPDVTCVFNQHVSIRSNIVIEPNQRNFLPLVSPSDSENDDVHKKFQFLRSSSRSARSESVKEFQLYSTDHIDQK